MTSPLTSDAIASIAMYLNAECSCQHFAEGQWNDYAGELHTGILVNLEVQSVSEKEHIRNFKLHLKPWTSLSDDQVRVLAGLAGYTIGECEFKRDENKVQLIWRSGKTNYCFEVWFDDAILCCETDDYGTNYFNPAPLIAQLIRWGFYVPGIVEEGLVMLKTE